MAEATHTSPGGPCRQFAADASHINNILHPRYDVMYDAMLKYVDERIERVVDILRENDVWDETVLIVIGDHGELLEDRGWYDHPNHFMFDELLKVPLLVRKPNGESRRLNHGFSLAWLHELIAELVDEPSGAFRGTSERSTYLERSAPAEPIVADSVEESGYSICVRDTDIKCVQHDLNEPEPYQDTNSSLYRICEDRGEHARQEGEDPLRRSGKSLKSTGCRPRKCPF